MRVRKVKVPFTRKRMPIMTVLLIIGAGVAAWKFWPQIKETVSGTWNKLTGKKPTVI